MGRSSTKENKNIYQQSRENASLTREAAAEKLEFISASKIEKIEYEKTLPHPEEVLAMAKCYKEPSLCNYYCSHECPIGQEYVPEVSFKELSQITLEMLASLNALEKEKNRLIEITVDGVISEDELNDFKKIQTQLSQISLAIDSLQLWVEKALIDGKIADSSTPA
ncbi:MAG: helix-turn-helix domain-containing protein [Agathobacter sp.]|nr:helix-turn-helix domain-containing protein [Agathobacter sp.]